MFRYAIATGRPGRDISLDLRGALTTPPVKHRAAVTKPSEVGALLRAIDGYTGQPTTRMALQFSALFFVRPGELRPARWREFDLSEAIWRIPAETMKMDRPHRVLDKLHGSGSRPFAGNVIDATSGAFNQNIEPKLAVQLVQLRKNELVIVKRSTATNQNFHISLGNCERFSVRRGPQFH